MSGSTTFNHLQLHNPIVRHIMKAGGTAEDCAVALSVANDRLVDRVMLLEGIVDRVMLLEGIAPRKIKLPDGRIMIWHCPDELVPEHDMSNITVCTKTESEGK